jgi:hypothetical protein
MGEGGGVRACVCEVCVSVGRCVCVILSLFSRDGATFQRGGGWGGGRGVWVIRVKMLNRWVMGAKTIYIFLQRGELLWYLSCRYIRGGHRAENTKEFSLNPPPTPLIMCLYCPCSSQSACAPPPKLAGKRGGGDVNWWQTHAVYNTPKLEQAQRDTPLSILFLCSVGEAG